MSGVTTLRIWDIVVRHESVEQRKFGKLCITVEGRKWKVKLIVICRAMIGGKEVFSSWREVYSVE